MLLTFSRVSSAPVTMFGTPWTPSHGDFGSRSPRVTAFGTPEVRNHSVPDSQTSESQGKDSVTQRHCYDG